MRAQWKQALCGNAGMSTFVRLVSSTPGLLLLTGGLFGGFMYKMHVDNEKVCVRRRHPMSHCFSTHL